MRRKKLKSQQKNHIVQIFLSITEGGLLILLDLWFRGLTKSLCLAAELSKQVENSGGMSKSTGDKRPQ